MLGLASTVSSSSTPEFKYSLTFDGTDDYVSIDSLSAELSNDMAYSLSIWFKGDSNEGLQHENTLFSAHTSDGTNRFRIGVNHSGGVFYSDNGTGDHTIGSDDLDDGAWHNIIITRPAGSGDQQAKVYVDGGSAITANLDDSDPVWDDVALVSIGQEWDGDLSTSDFYQGKIYEVAFWSVQLDDASRTKVYNSGKPFNLTLNVGNYDNSSSLIGYWRMGNGSFDDKANGVIHDQNTANRIYNGSFESTIGAAVSGSDILDWLEDANPDEWVISGGAASIDGGQSGAVNLSQNVYTLNKTYKTKLDVVRTAGTLTVKTGTSGNSLTITSSGTHEFSGVADNNIKIEIIADAAFAGSVDNIDVREVGGGHGFGSEMVTNGHFDTNVSGWTNNLSGDSTITQGSFGGRDGVARVVIDTNNQADRFEHDITWEKDCLYYFSVDVYLLSGKFRIDGDDDDIEGVGSNSSYTSTNVLGTITYDASVDDRWRTLTGYAKGGQTGGTDEIWIRSSSVAAEFYIDNFSVKKLNGNPALTSNTDVPTAFSSDTP